MRVLFPFERSLQRERITPALDQSTATCTKCGHSRPAALFLSKHNRPLKRCSVCRDTTTRANATRKRKAEAAAIAKKRRVAHRSSNDAEDRYRRTTPNNSSEQRANRVVCPFFPFVTPPPRERTLTLIARQMQARVTIDTTGSSANESYYLHQTVVRLALRRLSI